MIAATPSRGTNSLKKGLSVLSCFTWDMTSLTLTEIATCCGLSMPTASRIVRALEDEGFLERDSRTKAYHLGFKCYLLGSIARKMGGLRNIALPYMQELKQRFNETVNLYVREGFMRICYEQIESSLNLKRTAKLGARFPLWAGASGRCFLAFMEEEDVAAVLEEAEALTENTVLNISTVRELINRIRTEGFSISIAERERGVYSIAVPIIDGEGQAAGCMTLSGPSLRFTEDVTKEMIPALKETCLLISLKLGAPMDFISFLR